MADDGTVKDVTLVYTDGTKITPNLSAINEQLQGVAFAVNNNSLIITNNIWAYEFTDDNSAISVGNEDGSPIFPEGDYKSAYELWENTIEEYNTIVATSLYNDLLYKFDK